MLVVLSHVKSWVYTDLAFPALHRLRIVISDFRPPSATESGEAALRRLLASRAVGGYELTSDDPAPGKKLVPSVEDVVGHVGFFLIVPQKAGAQRFIIDARASKPTFFETSFWSRCSPARDFVMSNVRERLKTLKLVCGFGRYQERVSSSAHAMLAAGVCCTACRSRIRSWLHWKNGQLKTSCSRLMHVLSLQHSL